MIFGHFFHFHCHGNRLWRVLPECKDAFRFKSAAVDRCISPHISQCFLVRGACACSCQHFQLATYTPLPSHTHTYFLSAADPSQWIIIPLTCLNNLGDLRALLHSPLTARDPQGNIQRVAGWDAVIFSFTVAVLPHVYVLDAPCSLQKAPWIFFQNLALKVSCKFEPLKPQAGFSNFHIRNTL